MNSGKVLLLFVLAGISEARISDLLSDSKNSMNPERLSRNGNKVALVEKLVGTFNEFITNNFEENEAARHRKNINSIFDRIKSDEG